MTGSETKACTKCGEVKPLPDGFYYEKGKPRGYCKDCHKAKVYGRRDADREAHNARRRDYAASNPDKIAEQTARYRAKYKDEINAARRDDRAANPEKYREQERASWTRHRDRYSVERRAAWLISKDEENAKRRAQRASNPRIRETQRKHRAKNRKRINAYGRAYYARHPEKWENARRAREARKAGVEHQPYTRREIFERDGGVCRGCGKELVYAPHEFQIDHIVPISLGGPDIPANVQLMCPTCNRKKWATLEGQIHLPV